MHTLLKKIHISGKIIALTGLHIGGTNSAMAIGGPDKSVIRNPITQEPYVPGSSLKGKMRSLLELSLGQIGTTPMGKDILHPPTDNPGHLAAKLFGTANGESSQRPSKVIVRDARLCGSKEENEVLFKHTDLPFTESKTEVVIDRITSKAMPRQIERVPAGAEFSLNIVINIFQEDDEVELMNAAFHALQLVQDDYLGGNGSRGSGQVKFEITNVVERTAAFYLGLAEESPYREVPIPAALKPIEYAD